MISYGIYLSLPYLTKHNILHVHPCGYKWQYFILLYGKYFLVEELRSVCLRITKPENHTYWVCAFRSPCATTREKPMCSNKDPACHNEDLWSQINIKKKQDQRRYFSKDDAASLVAQTVKNPPAMWERPGLDPCVGKIPWRRAWQPTPIYLPGESHEQRSLAG